MYGFTQLSVYHVLVGTVLMSSSDTLWHYYIVGYLRANSWGIKFVAAIERQNIPLDKRCHKFRILD